MEQIEVSQSNDNEVRENDVNLAEQEAGSLDAVIDVETLNITESSTQDFVDLTKESGTTFVDLTKDDTPGQSSRRQRARRRGLRNLTHPYSQRQTSSLDDSADVVQETGSTSVESSPEQTSTKTICCPICMDDSNKINRSGQRRLVSTTCGHIFCSTCLEEAIRIQRKCPTCRRKLTTKQHHPIFI